MVEGNSNELLDELRKIKFWIKIANLKSIKEVVSDNLKSKEEILVYDLSNGNRSTREIASELKNKGISITHVTISNAWRRWSLVGLVEPSNKYKGRFQKAVSLEELGIEASENKENR